MTTETASGPALVEQARDALAQLQRCLQDAPHEDDAGAPNEQQRRWERRRTLTKHIGIFQSAIGAIVEADAQLPQLEPWRDFLVTARQTLCDELIACGRGPQRNGLELSIQQIDRGLPFSMEMLPQHLPLDDLLRVAGYQTTDSTLVNTSGKGWRGSLLDVERKIAALTKQREHAQSKLANALPFAGRLLSETTS